MRLCIELGLIIICLFYSVKPVKALDNLLESYISAALVDNPVVQFKKESWYEQEKRVPQAGALSNPILGFGVNNFPATRMSFEQEPMTSKQVNLTQMFPFPGKLKLKTEIAQRDVDISLVRLNETRNDITLNVKKTYYSLVYNRQAQDFIKRNILLLENLLSITETRYRVGKGLEQDIYKARTELSILRGILLTLRKKELTAVSVLNTLMNREPGLAVNSADSLIVEIDIPPQGKIVKIADTRNPNLISQRSVIDKLNMALQFARKNRLPDFSIRAVYAQRDERRDFVSLMGGMTLPIYHKRKEDKKIEELLHSVKRETAHYETIRNNLLNRISVMFAEQEEKKGLIILYRDHIIPNSIGTYESSLLSYQVDRVDFLTVLTNLMNLFKQEIEYHKVLAEHEITIAEIAHASGTDEWQ